MKLLKKLQSNLSFNIIFANVIVLLIFSLIIGIIGMISFKNAVQREYSKSTYRMAQAAVGMINGDKIDDYLAKNGNSDDYLRTKNELDKYCQNMAVTLIYVIKVDTTNYDKFVSIFNAVDANSKYTAWEIGYERDATNEEYVKTYRDIYEKRLDYGTIYRTNNLNGAEPHITTLVPVKNSKGDVVSILCIQRPMKEINDVREPYFINITISSVMLAIIISGFVVIFMRKQFVKPIKKIIKETSRFSKENKIAKPLGKISKITDISNIAGAIDQMEHDIQNYIENITQITSEKDKIEAELSVGRFIQVNSVPNVFPAFQDRKDFDVFAIMEPAREVGGDFYDFFLIDDDHLAMVMADVSGKGVPAALFMMVTRILINERAQHAGTPAEILEYVNKKICEHNKADMFITVWLGIMELSSGKIIAANAGHDNPIICHKGNYIEIVKNKRNVVIGAMETSKYENYEISINKGDKIFLYTDGVVEATDVDNNQYKMERLISVLGKVSNKKPEELLHSVRENISAFVGEAEQFDDLTMMCIELNERDLNDVESLKIEADNSKLPKVIDFINRFVDDYNCSDSDKMKIDLVAEEIFVNIANYAYNGEKENVDISIWKDADYINIMFKDSGRPFNPLEAEKPDNTIPVEDRKIGGLGIFLAKKNMDDIEYKYEENNNILILKKRI